MPAIVKRPPPRHNETRELTHPIRIALNKLPGVRIVRNNVGTVPLPSGGRITYGLGVGSADLVGMVTLDAYMFVQGGDAIGDVYAMSKRTIARPLLLELKRPGHHPSPVQSRWLRTANRLGAYAAVVHSLEEALDAVQRCRAGLSLP